MRTAALVLLLLVAGCDGPRPAPTPTPLAGFSAPFVFGRFEVPKDNPLTEEGVELGRRLFYDPRLSGNNQVSCGTCHVQRLAFTDGRRTSVGVSGKPLAFNSMGLANLLWGPQRFFWDGRAASLEEQALIPIVHPDEMAQDPAQLVDELSADAGYVARFGKAYGAISPATIARALASFERTLVSADSRYDRFLRGELELSEEEEHGRRLFMAHPDAKVSLRGGNCVDCHSQFLTAGFSARFDGFVNNGLDDDAHLAPGLSTTTHDPAHRGLFKVPSLRNVALTAPYMHDGRFATLEAVLAHYDGGIRNSATLSPLIVEADNRGVDTDGHVSLHLTAPERAAIIAFLHTLTDETFVSAERFSDPFQRP
ncbi:MAG TPA: cytochrome c peroxidase [Nevskiaceae bacterium]|nr:cytochrome c peroxidase [Nevskiaceae bacterium]